MGLALEGIRILDLSRMPPGSFCTMMLGDLGAEVIKIEPTGEYASSWHTGKVRGVSPRGEEGRRRAAYDALGRNKKSIGLNLKSEQGKGIFNRLAETADVVVETFSPGAVKRLGVDYESLQRINSGIVYCSITGYGQDGPYRDIPGHDINYISIAGPLGMIGEHDRSPDIPLNLIADYAGGTLHAITGILAALIAREKTGRGQYVDISMTDGAVSLFAFSPVVWDYFYDGIVPKRGEDILHGAFPFYATYKTRDEKLISIGCAEPWFWENLCRELGREDLISHQYATGTKRKEIFSSMQETFRKKTSDEWFRLLNQKRIPISKVNDLDEVFTDLQVLHRQMVVELDHPTEGKVKQVGIAVKLSDTPGEIRSFSPILGEHTDEVLLALGYLRDDVDKLRHQGIID